MVFVSIYPFIIHKMVNTTWPSTVGLSIWDEASVHPFDAMQKKLNYRSAIQSQSVYFDDKKMRPLNDTICVFIVLFSSETLQIDVNELTVTHVGFFVCPGSDDETVRFWEVSTGRCMKTLKVGGVVKKVVWNPNNAFCLLAVVV